MIAVTVASVSTSTLGTLAPDLTIRDLHLKSEIGEEVDSLRRGEPFYVCFEVANTGSVTADPFRIEGGGLGTRTAPNQAHASLAPDASREACLGYSTTPSPGKYRLGLTVDPTNDVYESREDNNGASVRVVVIR